MSASSTGLLAALEPVTTFVDAGVEVFHVRNGSEAQRDRVRTEFTAEPAIRFAGRVLAQPELEPSRPRSAAEASPPAEPVLYSENLFVKFAATVKAADARYILKSRGLELKAAVPYINNAYFVGAPEGTGLATFDIALELLNGVDAVELCHPELLRTRVFRGASSQQWHLKKATVNGTVIDAHANVVTAWKSSVGKGVTIAVIDDGVDVDHEEFKSAGKIVSPRDFSPQILTPNDPRPKEEDDDHGTACAGVAVGNGNHGASGVAPGARLMPIRLRVALGSQLEADAFAWAADHGADVISCSWGPKDGHWQDPNDPLHRVIVPLPDNTRLAIEYALTKGRGGKGCVIFWAAGNGNELVDNDGYAAFPGVIAVAACNDRGVRSAYSDTGKAIWCSFPSNDLELDQIPPSPSLPPGGDWTVRPAPLTPGIWTTDRSGHPGYNRGLLSAGDKKGNYTNSFGGTSSATPGVAGVAALMLSANPSLTNGEVRNLIKQACDRIDPQNGNYDPATGHSQAYGFGRVNAATAVALAIAAKGPQTAPKVPKAKKAKAAKTATKAKKAKKAKKASKK